MSDVSGPEQRPPRIQPDIQPTGAQQRPKQLTRSTRDRMVGGVCGGIAEYTGLDVNLIRVITVVVVLFGAMTPAVAYLLAGVMLPEDSPINHP